MERKKEKWVRPWDLCEGDLRALDTIVCLLVDSNKKTVDGETLLGALAEEGLPHASHHMRRLARLRVGGVKKKDRILIDRGGRWQLHACWRANLDRLREATAPAQGSSSGSSQEPGGGVLRCPAYWEALREQVARAKNGQKWERALDIINEVLCGGHVLLWEQRALKQHAQGMRCTIESQLLLALCTLFLDEEIAMRPLAADALAAAKAVLRGERECPWGSASPALRPCKDVWWGLAAMVACCGSGQKPFDCLERVQGFLLGRGARDPPVVLWDLEPIKRHLAQHRLTLQNDLLLGLCLLFACDGVMMPLSEGSMQVAKDTITETALVLS